MITLQMEDTATLNYKELHQQLKLKDYCAMFDFSKDVSSTMERCLLSFWANNRAVLSRTLAADDLTDLRLLQLELIDLVGEMDVFDFAVFAQAFSSANEREAKEADTVLEKAQKLCQSRWLNACLEELKREDLV